MIQVNIVSNQGAVWNGEATMLIASCVQGEVGILPNHIPFLSPLKPGDVIVKLENGEAKHFYVSGGILEAQHEVVTVLTDTAVRAESLDEAAILEAKKRAEDALNDKSGNIDYAKAQAQLVELVSQIRSIERARQQK
jgi:F-type H+-transporting ATPase subunit epsilon